MSRMVELIFNEGEMECIAETTGRKALWEAIGYLSTWGLRFPRVRILKSGGNDLLAVYLNDEGDTGYVIGAVWSESGTPDEYGVPRGSYSFHS